MRAQWIRMDRSRTITPLDRVGAAPEPRKPLVLLVHGYNNDEFQAADSFFRMRANVDELLVGAGVAQAIREKFQRRIWEFYWPGYEPLTLINPQGLPRSGFENALATSTYSLEVEKARTWVPDGLETYLTEVSPSDVFFVAHSLGCRVVVETAKRLLNSLSTTVRVAGFLLMAGAIPIHLLHELADLGPTTRQVARRYCFYSHRDTVLMLAFPPGQVAANEIPAYGAVTRQNLCGSPSTR